MHSVAVIHSIVVVDARAHFPEQLTFASGERRIFQEAILLHVDLRRKRLQPSSCRAEIRPQLPRNYTLESYVEIHLICKTIT